MVFRVRSYGLQLSAPATAYVERMLAVPAMREWFDAAVAETQRGGGARGGGARGGHDHRGSVGDSSRRMTRASSPSA